MYQSEIYWLVYNLWMLAATVLGGNYNEFQYLETFSSHNIKQSFRESLGGSKESLALQDKQIGKKISQSQTLST